MSDYTTSYAIRYQTPSLSQQTEVATVKAATDIQNEDSGAPDHANRLAWARWAVPNSSVASQSFAWAVAQNPTILVAINTDPSGGTVSDNDVQYIVNSNLDKVIADFVANPPPGIDFPTDGEQEPRLIISVTTSEGITTKDIMSVVLPVDHRVTASIQPVDAKGNPAKVDGVPVWSSSSETIATVAPAADGMSAVVTPVGALGSAQINIQADADLGQGTKPLAGTLDVDVVGGEAVSLGIQTAPPEPIPAT